MSARAKEEGRAGAVAARDDGSGPPWSAAPAPERAEAALVQARSTVPHAGPQAAPVARRGACPTLPEPMATGDGLLARLALAGPAAPGSLAALAGLALAHGNGILEVTARGKLQVRGLTAASAPAFAAAVGELGLPIREGLEVQASPLAGRDRRCAFDPRPLAAAIAAGARSGPASRVAPKVAVVVDGGGLLPLAGLPADIRLAPEADISPAGGGRSEHAGPPEAQDRPGGLVLSAGGRLVGRLPPAEAAAAVLALLGLLAEHGPAARMAALVGSGGAEGVALLRARLAAVAGFQPLEGPEPAAAAAEPLGLHPLEPGRFALGLAPAFGQMSAAALAALARAAAAHGADGIVPAPGRGLLVLGLLAGQAESLRALAAGLGFLADPADPRRRIAACPGAPACASGRLPARLLAEALAEAVAAVPAALPAGPTLHVSGCAKGCAHPAAAAITLVGLDAGAGLVLQGTACDAPRRLLPLDGLVPAVRRLLETDLG
ncbi:precorrin-3B synthase [Ancylobacter lacus]|uniref:precorrin-3B synthase n=1 Tax=Ancylobacter lacus TaxID=2579970 RepID=UPI001BCB6BF0|nr:precorrin-3B synthase [Ancylobacter lacus]MBS7537854.1 precorrin-3B synthase [Ancylobacter lacus]